MQRMSGVFTPRGQDVASVVDLIGHTPLLRLGRFTADTPEVEILAKAEFLNPGGSVKDRAAAAIIREAERQGHLRPGTTILDATSGNTGIAYAMIAAARGYRLTLCVPDNVTVERKRTLRAYGAELILTDPMEGTDGAIREARRRQAANPDRYFYADQYNNDANWRAHFETTATEILEQTDGRVTHFVAGLGTSGTFVGVGRRLREFNPRVHLVSVQPDSPLERHRGPQAHGDGDPAWYLRFQRGRRRRPHLDRAGACADPSVGRRGRTAGRRVERRRARGEPRSGRENLRRGHRHDFPRQRHPISVRAFLGGAGGMSTETLTGSVRALAITADALAAIHRHGAETYPHECCGALLEVDGVIVATFALPNTTEGPAARRFLVGPDEYRRAEGWAARAARRTGRLLPFASGSSGASVTDRSGATRGRISCTLSCRSPEARRATPPAGVCARIARDSTKEN